MLPAVAYEEAGEGAETAMGGPFGCPPRLGPPQPRTWHRRIRAEKLHLLQGGVPVIEIHLVSRLLANPSNRFYEAR